VPSERGQRAAEPPSHANRAEGGAIRPTDSGGLQRWASFDCYGTLIDWNGGLRSTFTRLWPDADLDAVLASYHEVEPRVQEGSSKPYPQVMADSLRLVADHEGLPLAAEDEVALGEALPGWEAFTEVSAELWELRERGWSLAILSNTDPELLDASIQTIGVPVDAVVTAREAGSYKPAHGHWHRLFERPDVDRDRHAHVAASLFHDVVPCLDLAVPVVWINRESEEPEPPPTAELRDLTGLADTLDRLVPA
jgi:2-haloalkanoic acid dehalogenase type II